MAAPMEEPTRTTYVLVDGENIDATLGNSLLGGCQRVPGHPPFRFQQHTGDDGRVQCRNRVSHTSVQRIQRLRHVDATRGRDDGKRGRGVRAERGGEPPTQ